MQTDVLSIEFRRGVREAFDKGMAGYGGDWYKIYEQIYGGGAYGIMDSDGYYEELGDIPGIADAMTQTSRRDPAPYMVAGSPRIFAVEHTMYKAAIAFLYDIMKNDKIGWHQKIAQSFGEVPMWTRELIGHELLNRATDATLTSGFDNKPLGSSTHVLPNGTVVDNTLAAMGFSEGMLKQVSDYFDKTPTPEGRPRPQRTAQIRIVTKFSNLDLAEQILTNIQKNVATVDPVAGVATTANQNPAQTNILQSRRYTIIGTPYINSATRHICQGPKHGLFWYNRDAYNDNYTLNNPKGSVEVRVDEFSTGYASFYELLVIG